MDTGREDEIRARLTEIAGPEPEPAERALLVRLLRSFAARTPPGVQRLGELMRGGDPAAVRDHAHALKGAASNIGAGTLAGMLAEVEQAARDGAAGDAGGTLGRLAAEQALAVAAAERLAGALDR